MGGVERISLVIIHSLKFFFQEAARKKYNFSNAGINSEAFQINYALHKQYRHRVSNGYPYNFFDKEILEIGCGHGGIAVFLAVNGAKKVVGIDLNTIHLKIANKFKAQTEERLQAKEQLPVQFMEMSAYDLHFQNESFDMVIADNVFEHFDQTLKVFKEAFRVLKPGGQLIVPSFNAIKSKHGAHLKYGLGIPWLNVFFSEKSICLALSKIAEKEPDLFEAYPGLKTGAVTLAGLRAYNDLNGMTHRRFVKEAKEAGFILNRFHIFPPFRYFKTLFAILYKLHFVRYSWFGDIFSKGASAILEKPKD